MGQFVAYKKSDDTPAGNISTTNNKTYYTQILKDALGGYFTPRTENDRQSLVGRINLDDYISDKEAAKRLIANEEGKYYYKWQDGAGEVMGPANSPVLNALERVDIKRYLYYATSGTKPIPNDRSALQDRLVTEYIKYQDASLSNGLDNITINSNTPSPLKLPLTFSKDDNQLEAHADNDAIPLYLDTDVNTQWRKYKIGDNDSYNAVNTWIPKAIGSSGAPTQPEEYEYFKPGEAFEGGNLRYVYYLYFECEEIMKLTPQAMKIWKKKETKKAYPTMINSLGVLISAGTVTALKVLESFLTNVATPEATTAARETAEDLARIIPPGYRCFYYSTSEGTIDGFLAYVNLGDEGESGRPSSGYEGRADRASEVNYYWKIAPFDGDDEFYLAKLLSYIIGLDRSRLLPTGANPCGDGPLDFHETNYPFSTRQWINDKRAIRKKTFVADGALLFRYYKQFKQGIVRRNEPKANIDPPRSGIGLLRADTDNIGLRKWKKGASLEGEPRLKGNPPDRKNAGAVLAKALKEFNFYPQAMAHSKANVHTAITRSNLSATSFSKFVIDKDAKAGAQWVDDNQGQPDPSVVKTDQEWCHLYGHGDGGEEVLDNFVSGSKHCNTEQLGIETGQRRVSRNPDIPSHVRDLLTWKITADQFPNLGSMVSYIDPKIATDALNKLKAFPDHIKINEMNKQKQRFFNGANSKLSLKTDAEIRRGLMELANDISAARNDYRVANGGNKNKAKDKLVALLAFQREFLSNCFLYYPLGRRIRYRIFFNGTKCFEHHFDAQSQSFDLNEAKILDYTVERAIYIAMDKHEKSLPNNQSLGIKKHGSSGQISPLEYYDELIMERTKDFALSATEQSFVDAVDSQIKGLKLDVDNELDLKKLQGHLDAFSAILKQLPSDKSKKIDYINGMLDYAIQYIATAIEAGNSWETNKETYLKRFRYITEGLIPACQASLSPTINFNTYMNKKRKKQQNPQ